MEAFAAEDHLMTAVAEALTTPLRLEEGAGASTESMTDLVAPTGAGLIPESMAKGAATVGDSGPGLAASMELSTVASSEALAPAMTDAFGDRGVTYRESKRILS